MLSVPGIIQYNIIHGYRNICTGTGIEIFMLRCTVALAAELYLVALASPSLHYVNVYVHVYSSSAARSNTSTRVHVHSYRYSYLSM